MKRSWKSHRQIIEKSSKSHGKVMKTKSWKGHGKEDIERSWKSTGKVIDES